jgi:hypothetical protein
VQYNIEQQIVKEQHEIEDKKAKAEEKEADKPLIQYGESLVRGQRPKKNDVFGIGDDDDWRKNMKHV